MMMPRTRKKTRSINSFAEARNVCNRIFSPDECRVSLNSLRRILIKSEAELQKVISIAQTHILPQKISTKNALITT